jgi:hypothetical protein
MLPGYVLVLGLAGSVGPAPCGNVCACGVPLSAASSPESNRRYTQREAYTILLGTVIAVDTTARDSVKSPYGTSARARFLVYPTAVRYTLAVERSWKGPLASAVTITDYDVGGECARRYEKGQAYLIYAQKDRRREEVTGLTTTICSRVLLRSKMDAEQRRLGKGRAIAR